MAHAASLVILALAAVVPRAAHAQATAELRGKVTNARTREPIAGARITVTALDVSAETDADGRYRLTGIAPGSQLLALRATGYQADTARVELAAGEVILRDFTLAVDARPAPVAALQGARRVRGLVRDSAGTPVPNVLIELGGERRVTSDDSGRFGITAPAVEALTLAARRLGFQPEHIDVAPGGDTTITVTLMPVALELPTETVKGEQSFRSLELSGFNRRLADKGKGINAGQFITAEEIEKRKPYRLTNIFDGLAGMRMQRIHCPESDSTRCLGDPEYIAPTGLNRCWMTVYLNGIRLNKLSRDPETNWANGIDNLVSWSAVAGIEVYTSPGRVPPEYQRLGGNCGAILIWTK